MDEEELRKEKYIKMLSKLEEIYDKEDKLKMEYEQLQEDKELLQNLIMYQFNKDDRVRYGQANNKVFERKPKKNFW